MASIGQAAASQGAGLVVFSETFIAGYPLWIWRLRPGSDWGPSEQLHARLVENAVDIRAGELAPLCEAARRHRVVVCDLNERDGRSSRSTLYNRVVIIGDQGEILNRHRKLMPTNPERMVWGMGDASRLRVVETPTGRLSPLMCWENYMPLARYALYAQGGELYITPTYDSGGDWLGSLQHIAREGCCWVIGCGTVIEVRDLPDDLPDRRQLYPDPDEWINPGDLVVIAPGGRIIAGPMHREKGILQAEIDLTAQTGSRRVLDVAGHYARPDIFELRVNRLPVCPVRFDE